MDKRHALSHTAETHSSGHIGCLSFSSSDAPNEWQVMVSSYGVQTAFTTRHL